MSEEDEKEREELEDKEIWQVIRKMKKRKAAGVDDMETWIHGGTSLKKYFTEFVKEVWRKGEIPKDWKTSIVVPIFKKGNTEEVGNYRGIAIQCSAYKIYAELLRRRLEEELDKKEVLPESQRGFRVGRSTIDNIFILNHLSQREKVKKDKKLYTAFVNLSAAFAKVEREKLWKILEDKDIKDSLIRK